MKASVFTFPIIVFKSGDKNLYCFLAENSFGIVSKGSEKFYKNFTVIDSNGNVFNLKESTIRKVASFITCLKYMQKMWEMNLEFEATGEVSLTEVKDRVMDHVSKNPKHWLSLDTLDGIRGTVSAAKSFRELFVIFK